MGTTMAPADAVWYLGETRRNPMTISSLLWLDGPIEVDELRRRLEARVVARHPAFRQCIVPSRMPGRLPRWEPVADVDVADHLDVVDLPAPGDHTLLEALCSLERSTPLDRSRPLWRVTVYRGYRGNGTAIHARLHHSFGDGIALMRLMLTLGDEHRHDPRDDPRHDPRHDPRDDPRHDPVPEPGTPADPGQATAAPSRTHPPPALAQELRELTSLAVQHAVHPTRMVATTRQAASVARWTARLLLPDVLEPNVLHGTPQGTKRMVWDPDGRPLAPVKAAGRAVGATVNEVLLTMLTSALRRYLVERDALVEVVQVMMPVSLRDPGAPLPSYLGNRIGLLPVHLPVGCADPLQQLRELHAQAEALKHSPAPVISHLILAGSSLITAEGERSLHRFNQWRSTGVITNVPGPKGPLHIAGSRVLGTVGWGGLMAELNLTGSFISFGGRVFCGFVTDTAVTEDPHPLLVHLGDTWSDTLAVFGQQGP